MTDNTDDPTMKPNKFGSFFSSKKDKSETPPPNTKPYALPELEHADSRIYELPIKPDLQASTALVFNITSRLGKLTQHYIDEQNTSLYSTIEQNHVVAEAQRDNAQREAQQALIALQLMLENGPSDIPNILSDRDTTYSKSQSTIINEPANDSPPIDDTDPTPPMDKKRVTFPEIFRK